MFVIELDDIARFPPEVHDYEVDPWKKLSRIPLDLGDKSVSDLPTDCLISKAVVQDNRLLRWASQGSSQKMLNFIVQNLITFQADGFAWEIDLWGKLGQQSRNVSSLFNDSALAWQAGANALTPLYRGGLLKGNLQVAQAQFRQARLNYERIILQSFREVNDAMANYTYAADIRQAQENLVQATREYSDLALQNYIGGEVSYIEYLDAQRRLFSAELSLSQTFQQQLTALISIYRALGGGWNPDYSNEALE